ncbi:MAG: asparagine synthase (glutamine-hydrolyzing), partial [Gammaproteobacteria bacterium]
LLEHRGPDDRGEWVNSSEHVGLAHRRLSIIDLTDSGHQPMLSESGAAICFNGEIYNYLELKKSLINQYRFKTESDTETILATYERYGLEFLDHLRGMFAFALWDPKNQRLVCARDRFGIKPFYYLVQDNVFYFASEPKALLPFVHNIETDKDALADYLTFQYCLGEQTLFKDIKQLMPGHMLVVQGGGIQVKRYWDVHYDINHEQNADECISSLRDLLDDSTRVHMRSDVPLGSYLSGGVDSSLIAILASRHDDANSKAFHGRFLQYPGYDESPYAQTVAKESNKDLYISDMTDDDFLNNIEEVIYHLDYPVAGPGSFPQYMVSKLASEHVKVVLGGQGGDEIFGGYARYLLAYFEQCIKAAIDGTYKNGNFVVTAESIIPNLGLLREYKPLMKMFWEDGLFDSLDKRYFRLIDRSADMDGEVSWQDLDRQGVVDRFSSIFNSTRNVKHEAYFDSMTHFDFKCLLPALLHVEDRMSMAHGLESRVPMLDHPVIEFAATVPADVKFKNGHMKHFIKEAYADVLPASITQRRDKMGFPVPLNEWFDGKVGDYVRDLFASQKASNRDFFNVKAIQEHINGSTRFSRKMWGLLSLEIWQQQFHDKQSEYKSMINNTVELVN